jgi:Flp pilus assembly protein TadG
MDQQRSEKGQGMVEFALIIVLFLFILLTAVEVLPAYNVITSVKAAANHGVREAVVWDPSSGNTCEQAVQNAVASRTTDVSTPTITITGCSGFNFVPRGQYITVTVSVIYRPPFYSTLGNPPVPRTFVIERSATLRNW